VAPLDRRIGRDRVDAQPAADPARTRTRPARPRGPARAAAGHDPGVGDLLGPTIASEIGDISRFASARKLIGYSGLTPRVHESGQSARTGKLSKTGSTMLRWAAIEAAQQAWRPNNPWYQL
jgi:transposase